MARTDEPVGDGSAQSDTGSDPQPDVADGAHQEALNDDSESPGVPKCTVVGIGASAGGLEAFGELLNALPSDTGMAFVLIQHLDPRHPSALAGLLGQRTKMPVVEVSDRTVVRPNRVYVIPPNAKMTVARGVLR